MEQNLFQRLIQRVSETFKSLFSGNAKTTVQTSEDPSQGHRDDQANAAKDAHLKTSLSSLDLNLFHKVDTVIGNGEEAFAGADVTVHYTGWLIDSNASDLKGQKFDSSVDRGQTFNFPLGQGHVIRGWDEGFAGMKIGGKRTLLIPPDMGYGARGAGGVIPPNATLMFEVELFGVN